MDLYHGTTEARAREILASGVSLAHFGWNTNQTEVESPAGRAISVTASWRLAREFASDGVLLLVALDPRANIARGISSEIDLVALGYDKLGRWSGQRFQERLIQLGYDGAEWGDEGWHELNVWVPELLQPIRIIEPGGVKAWRKQRRINDGTQGPVGHP